jgi:ferric-dicitrate binding protein FerR (iron transport regulator)
MEARAGRVAAARPTWQAASVQPVHLKTSAGLFLPTLSTLLSWPGGSCKSSGRHTKLLAFAAGAGAAWLLWVSLAVGAGGAMERQGGGARRTLLLHGASRWLRTSGCDDVQCGL